MKEMKKSVLFLCAVAVMCFFTACNGGNKAQESAAETEEVSSYTLLDLPTIELDGFQADAEGWISIFDGTSFNGWRGYNREDMPAAWTIEDNSIKIQGSGNGEAGAKDGGDIIFAHKFKNFELEMEWKVGKGSNSGIFYLAQEVDGEPIYISAPECQVLDNENHPDAKLGVDGNRKSSSLYDMIPADPQNSKPFGEWNKVKIVCFKGTVIHYQNDEQVLEYHLWTKAWENLLMESKFKQGSKDFPVAYELLSNCGGPNKEGFIGLQDHGDDVWFRNIKVKVLD
ncbi:hypothetical protein Barb6_01127 [Bacteroidales bacterium Barb6]|nr:hypothetical protein Barb6_01127 [Bacteroidales bacterium Barb6]